MTLLVILMVLLWLYLNIRWRRFMRHLYKTDKQLYYKVNPPKGKDLKNLQAYMELYNRRSNGNE